MKSRVFLLLVLGVANSLFASNGTSTRSTSASTNTYSTGESLEYSISFGFYTGARAYLTVLDSNINGVATQRLVARAKTVGIADRLFRIRDRYESFIELNSGLPVLSIRDIREGRYRNYNEITYNRDLSQAISLRTGVHAVPNMVQDMLSTFYFARKHNFNDSLAVDQLLFYEPFFCDELYSLILRFRGFETIECKFGNLECYKFSLCEKRGNELVTLDNMSFWVTHDANRIPVKVEFEISVGSFVVELEKYSGLLHPLVGTF